MDTAEERNRILRMVESGHVTAEEAARLLEALRGDVRPQEKAQTGRQGLEPNQLRIQVTDLETGRQKINMRLPWGLVNVGLNMGARFARDEIQVQDFIEAVQAGATGKIVDVVDEECHERVEIYVE